MTIYPRLEPSFQESAIGQKPTTVEASTLEPTPPSPNPHLSGFRDISITMFYLTCQLPTPLPPSLPEHLANQCLG